MNRAQESMERAVNVSENSYSENMQRSISSQEQVAQPVAVPRTLSPEGV